MRSGRGVQRLIVDWLQIIRRDPHLPVQHLPGDWPALQAQSVFMSLQRRLGDRAARIAARVLDTIPDDAPESTRKTD